jgi:hypothetical protein
MCEAFVRLTLVEGAQEMNNNLLHITVTAAPSIEFGNPRLLEHDLKLAKSAILYADRIKLCSPTAWWAASFFGMATFPQSDREQVEVLSTLYRTIGPTLDPNAEKMIPELDRYLVLIRRNPMLLTKRQRVAANKFKEFALGSWEKLRIEFVRITRGFGFDEIEVAANAGLLEICPFSETPSEKLAQEYFETVQKVLGSSDSHPLLDDQTNNLVTAALKEGKLSVSSGASRRSKQTGLVANLFDRLPVFDVPMSELIDLREELSKPLINFRSKIIGLSEDVGSCSWDDDFSSDIQETYHKSIEPVLLEIEEELQSLRFRNFWTRRMVDKAGALTAGAAASVALGAAVAPWAGIIGAIAGLAVFTEAGFADLEDQRRNVERNGLYFYHRLRQEISK